MPHFQPSGMCLPSPSLWGAHSFPQLLKPETWESSNHLPSLHTHQNSTSSAELTWRAHCTLNPSASLWYHCYRSRPNHYHFLSGQLQVFYPIFLFFFPSSHPPCMLRPLHDLPGTRIKSNLLGKCKVLHYLWLSNSNFISSYSSSNLPKPTMVQVQVLQMYQGLLTSRRLHVPFSWPTLFSPFCAPSHTQFNVIS